MVDVVVRVPLQVLRVDRRARARVVVPKLKNDGNAHAPFLDLVDEFLVSTAPHGMAPRHSQTGGAGSMEFDAPTTARTLGSTRHAPL